MLSLKKLVLIIAIILCVATISGVFALAIFDSQPVVGTITADDYLFLEMNSEFSANLELLKGTPVIKAINLHIRSFDKTDAYLKISTISKTEKNLSNVSFSLYSSQDCKNLLTDSNGNECTIRGDGIITYLIPENTDTSLTVYLKIVLDDDITETEFDSTGGKLTLSLSEKA